MNYYVSSDQKWMFALVAFAIVASIVGGIIGSIREKKRREALAAWAARLRLNFSEGKDRSFQHRFPGLSVLRSGEGGQYAFNVASGQLRGRGFLAFDYHYETYSRSKKGGRRTHHYYLSAVVLEAGFPLLQLHIRPEGLLDKIAEAFGQNDIDFESAEFSRRYRVAAADRKWAYDILHTRAIEQLLRLEAFSLEFDQARAVLWTSGRWEPEVFERRANELADFMDAIPDYVRRQQAGGIA